MKVTVRAWKLKKGELLYLDVYHQGSRIRENLEIVLDGGRSDDEKRRMAEILRARRELELLANVHGLTTGHAGRITLADFAAGIDSQKVRDCHRYIASHFKEAQIRAVTRRHVEGFQAYLVACPKPRGKPGQALSLSTVESYMQGLATVFNRAVSDRIIPESPMIGVARVRADNAPPSSLTVEELATLARTRILGEDGVGGEVKRAFFFACQTGLRWSDLRALTWAKIRGRQIEVTQRKTRDAVYIPLNDRAWELVNPGDRLPVPAEHVFPLLASAAFAAQWMVAWGKSAGLTGLHFHQSRHTFIRSVLDAGADLATAQGLAGHRNIATTAKYGRASDKQKRAAVDRL